LRQEIPNDQLLVFVKKNPNAPEASSSDWIQTLPVESEMNSGKCVSFSFYLYIMSRPFKKKKKDLLWQNEFIFYKRLPYFVITLNKNSKKRSYI
jgi:hypothetical protein